MQRYLFQEMSYFFPKCYRNVQCTICKPSTFPSMHMYWRFSADMWMHKRTLCRKLGGELSSSRGPSSHYCTCHISWWGLQFMHVELMSPGQLHSKNWYLQHTLIRFPSSTFHAWLLHQSCGSTLSHVLHTQGNYCGWPDSTIRQEAWFQKFKRRGKLDDRGILAMMVSLNWASNVYPLHCHLNYYCVCLYVLRHVHICMHWAVWVQLHSRPCISLLWCPSSYI